MLENPIILYATAALLASIPAVIWLLFLFKKSKRRGIQLIIFLGSIFSVVPVFLLHYFLNLFPQFDILSFLQNQIHDQNINYILLFISVGIVEEIVKQALVRWADSRFLLIHTINDSIRFSLVAALGFAFAENIFYIVSIYTQLGLQQLIIAYLFRSIFTVTAHLLFSGIFGYYYGIAKFSINIVEHEQWTGRQKKYPAVIAKVFGMSRIHAYKEVMILRGLALAIILHAVFNLLLQFNFILPVAIYVVCGALFLWHKLNQKSGELILITNAAEMTSSMHKKDEEVVIELLGMWFNNKKYVDVIHICQRLLERDPDNKVVQLFKAKAMDKMDKTSAYSKILSSLFPKNEKSHITIEQMVKEKSLRENRIITKPPVIETPPDIAKKTAPPAENPTAVTPVPSSTPTDDRGTFDLDL